MTRRGPREDGFTLVEVLMAMTLSLVVAAAALGAFEAFDRGVAANTRLTAGEDTARREMGVLVRSLRSGGAPAGADGVQPIAVTRAGGTDVVFLSTAWPGESGTGATGRHVERYCLDAATRTLWFDGLRAGTTGPTDPGASCPSQAAGWTHRKAVTGVVNSTDRPIFSYPAVEPFRSIGISLRIEGGTATKSRPVELRSGVTLRGALAPQITGGDIEEDCDSGDGPGKALLSLGVGGGELSAPGGLEVGPGQLLVDLASLQAGLTVTVTDALGLSKLIFVQRCV